MFVLPLLSFFQRVCFGNILGCLKFIEISLSLGKSGFYYFQLCLFFSLFFFSPFFHFSFSKLENRARVIKKYSKADKIALMASKLGMRKYKQQSGASVSLFAVYFASYNPYHCQCTVPSKIDVILSKISLISVYLT